MKQYQMPYSFIFTDEELCDLWSHYRQISQIIRCVEERHSLVITDAEVHAGAHFRARALLDEAQRRVIDLSLAQQESLQSNALMPREMPPFETVKILGE